MSDLLSGRRTDIDLDSFGLATSPRLGIDLLPQQQTVPGPLAPIRRLLACATFGAILIVQEEFSRPSSFDEIKHEFVIVLQKRLTMAQAMELAAEARRRAVRERSSATLARAAADRYWETLQ